MKKNQNVGLWVYQTVVVSIVNVGAVSRVRFRSGPLLEVGRFEHEGVIHRWVHQDDTYSACNAFIPKDARASVDIDTPLTCIPCLAEQCERLIITHVYKVDVTI